MKHFTAVLILLAVASLSFAQEAVTFTENEMAYAQVEGWKTDSTNAEATAANFKALYALIDGHAEMIAINVVHKRAVELPKYGGEKGWANTMLGMVATTEEFFASFGAKNALADTSITQDERYKLEAVVNPPDNPYVKVDPSLKTQVVKEYAPKGKNDLRDALMQLSTVVANLPSTNP